MLLLAAVAMNAFLAAFAGTWNCTPHLTGVVSPSSSTWTIGADAGTPWAVVHWHARGGSGVAYVGYLAPEAQWIYEDFHSDGSFATNTSPGPQNGAWTWTGTYTTAQRTQHIAIQWRREGDGIRQSFGRMLGTSFRETQYSSCRRI